MRRLGQTFRKGVVVGVVIGLAYALARWLRAAPPGVTPLDARPAPAASPEPTEAAWAPAPVVSGPVPPTMPDDAPSSPLAAVLDEMAAEAMVNDAEAAEVHTPPPTGAAATSTNKSAAAAEKTAPAKKTAGKKVAAKKTAARKVAARAAPTWVDPDGRTCPPSHPVKVRTASGIFHLPGGLAYGRTTPDRCYAEAAEAEADGYRAAKR